MPRRHIPILHGSRFGKWVVLSGPHRYQSKAYPPAYECRCDCGVTKTVKGNSLRAGTSGSCGCRMWLDPPARTHGASTMYGETPEYKAWCKLKARCYNRNDK